MKSLREEELKSSKISTSATQENIGPEVLYLDEQKHKGGKAY